MEGNHLGNEKTHPQNVQTAGNTDLVILAKYPLFFL